MLSPAASEGPTAPPSRLATAYICKGRYSHRERCLRSAQHTGGQPRQASADRHLQLPRVQLGCQVSLLAATGPCARCSKVNISLICCGTAPRCCAGRQAPKWLPRPVLSRAMRTWRIIILMPLLANAICAANCIRVRRDGVASNIRRPQRAASLCATLAGLTASSCPHLEAATSTLTPHLTAAIALHHGRARRADCGR